MKEEDEGRDDDDDGGGAEALGETTCPPSRRSQERSTAEVAPRTPQVVGWNGCGQIRAASPRRSICRYMSDT